MSEPKFTPGPWVLRPGICRNDHPDTSADVHGPQAQFVADCGCHETATANARLIAAAPEMYAALRGLAKRLSEGPMQTWTAEAWTEEIRAVLKKAVAS